MTGRKITPKNDLFLNCRRKTKQLSKKELSNVAPASRTSCPTNNNNKIGRSLHTNFKNQLGLSLQTNQNNKLVCYLHVNQNNKVCGSLSTNQNNNLGRF